MSNGTCTLTTKDFTILEIMRDRCLGRDDPLAGILRRKIETARVVPRDDVPPDIATLGSRVTFRSDGSGRDTRVLAKERMASPVGLFLSIVTPRGLALLGLAEGDEFRLPGHGGVEERILLEKVHYQPEAARRHVMAELAPPARPRPVLKLVRGALFDHQVPAPTASSGFDDPGPSAA